MSHKIYPDTPPKIPERINVKRSEIGMMRKIIQAKTSNPITPVMISRAQGFSPIIQEILNSSPCGVRDVNNKIPNPTNILADCLKINSAIKTQSQLVKENDSFFESFFL